MEMRVSAEVVVWRGGSAMEEHVRIAAILRIVYSGLGLVASAIVFLVFGGLAVLAAVADPSSAHQSASVLTLIGVWIAALVGICGLPGVIVGWGMLRYRPWARILGIILAFLDLPAFPLGTALGIYSLWVLLNPQVAEMFEYGGPVSPPRF
jgi:hypothetical protein